MVLPIALVPGVPGLLVASALAAMLVVSFLGVVIKAAGGPRVYQGVMGKPDRMLVLGIAAIAGLATEPRVAFTLALWVVLTGAAITLGQRALIARRELGRTR
jgi:phosphatidylglycerophosphate synthase